MRKLLGLVLFSIMAIVVAVPAYAQENIEQKFEDIKPSEIAIEISKVLGSTDESVKAVGGNAQQLVELVRHNYPAITPEAAESLAGHFIDLLLEKIAPLQEDIQAKVITVSLSEEELAMLSEFIKQPGGAELIQKIPGLTNAMAVMIGRETQVQMRAIQREALVRTEADGHKLSYGEKTEEKKSEEKK